MINGMNDVDKTTVSVRQNNTSVFLVGDIKIQLHSCRSMTYSMRDLLE